MPQRLEIITGTRFGRNTVIAEVERRVYASGPVRAFLCKCDCGVEKVIPLACLRNGKTKSCGCWDIDNKTSHNCYSRPVYQVWSQMKQRCSNPKCRAFKIYGGRGIKYCPEWESFESFYRDMGDPKQGMTLDRIDNDKGYCKDNCRWVSRKEQANNRRTNRKIEYMGQAKTISQWAEALGVNSSTLWYKLKRSPEDMKTLAECRKNVENRLNNSVPL